MAASLAALWLMSLSGNLKLWSIIEKRLNLACAADFVLAFYNPISGSRPWQLGVALEIVARHRSAETPVVLGRDIGRLDQILQVTTLDALTPNQYDGSDWFIDYQHLPAIRWRRVGVNATLVRRKSLISSMAPQSGRR